MELLYIWINKNQCIEQQEFNISNRYKFELKQNSSTKYYELTCTENTEYIPDFFDDSGIIENITAIVGANGSGKTTLLKSLHGLNCFSKNEETREDYKNLFLDEYEKNETVFVMKDNCDIVIFHNINPDDFINKTSFQVIEGYTNNSKIRGIYQNLSHFKDITSIYLTNSFYTNNKDYNYSSSGQSLDEVNLTPNALTLLSKQFYKNLLFLNNNSRKFNSKIKELHEKIFNNQDEHDFQSLCDILYLSNLYKKQRMKSYQAKINQTIQIGVRPITSFLSSSDYLFKKNLDEKYKRILSRLKINHINTKDITIILYLNLLIEISIYLNIEGEIAVSDFSDLFIQISKYIDSIEKEEVKRYYSDAFMEIENIGSILLRCSEIENLVPCTDMAFKIDKIISSEVEDNFIKFLNFIEDSIYQEQSFVLKYLSIQSIHMSSGERAYQNMFSWINLLSFFHKIDSSIPNGLKKNILLLIDEIDLYAHPEWQRKFLSNLIDEIKQQFKEYKVQIIFTTHSPLVLSDMPRQNTIYLKNTQGKVRVSESKTETFATNLYTLLNDAFYLDNGEIGAFAVKKINKIINNLKEYDSHDEVMMNPEIFNMLKKEINLIGDELIHRKLLERLEKCRYKTDLELQIMKLEFEKNLIDSKIEQLRKRKKDDQ